MRKTLISYLFIVIICILKPVYAKQSVQLSIGEAILLAVRSNPNVQSSRLTYVAQKFNAYVQQWEFYPHYSLQAVAVAGPTNYNISPGVSLLTPIGTQVNVTATNAYTNRFKPGLSLQIMQPLMRGFGTAVVEAALNNAKDTEIISYLNVEETLRMTVTAVINAYLDVVTAERSISIDNAALQRAKKSVAQTKLFIKAGHKAGNELVTVEANVASAHTQLINDKNNLIQARNALLTAIGIDPNSNVSFSNLNIDELINKYILPTLVNAKRLILQNDIQYQIDKITLHGPTSRNLFVAEDNQRWQLNAAANVATGYGSNQPQSVALTLQVPIDNQLLKQAVVNAKIALQQAELALLQEKWSKETSAINGWNLVVSAKQSLQYAGEAEKLQEKTYRISYQKYLHGLIDSLELQTAQVQLIQAQQVFLSAQINYLKALVNLDFLVGNTLKTWDVKVRLE